jgi:hypothetical protein
MNTTALTATAAQLVEAFGSTAHTAIDAYQAGGERLGRFAAQRWDVAFEQAKPQLSGETRRNAANARKVFSRYYRQGLQLSSHGAATAVDTLVQVAGSAIARADAYGRSRA